MTDIRLSPRRLMTGAALALVLAAGGGFGLARLLQPAAPAVSDPATSDTAQEDTAAAATGNEVTIDEAAIRASRITVAPAGAGELDAAITASATIEPLPDAEAVLTARAAGTVSRLFKREGDFVRAGETLALVESREAAAMAADKSAAAARVTLARQQLARESTLLSQGVAPRADVETAQANLALARAEALRASAAAGAARLAGDGRSIAVVSPVSGRITSSLANLGQFVAPETELFRVVDPQRVQVHANVTAYEATRVRGGDKAELVDSQGGTWTGHVRTTAGAIASATQAVTVMIELAPGANSPPPNLVPGQFLKARIFASGGAARHAVVVPQDAIQTVDDRSVVFVRTPRGFRIQPVQLGARSDGRVAIASGLVAGTAIATGNAFLLKAELEKESAE